MKAPIVSRKHIVQHTQTVLASGAVASLRDVISTSVQNVNAAADVVEGSVIKAIYVEIWIGSNTGIEPAGSIVLMVEKAPGDIAAPVLADMTTLDAYDNKKNIFYTTQGIIGSNTANPVPFIRQWIRIPKGKQRFGLRDEFRINIAAIGAEDISFCGLTIYKSYS